MNDKLTDSEIKKALERCIGDSCYTSECSFFEETKDDEHCQRVAIKHALDLINRQDEEINRLQAENERLNVVHYCIDRAILGNQEFAIADEYLIAYQNALEHLYNNINLKAEAYKEFANEFGNMLWQMKTEYLQQGDTEYASALVIYILNWQNS